MKTRNQTQDPRGFKALSIGRAVELVELVIGGRNLSDDPEEADALLELLAGVCDEMGESNRFTAALAAMRHVHALRSEEWLSHVGHLQNGRVEARPQ